MKKNIGSIDKGLRVLVAITIAVLYFTGVISGSLAIGLGFLALIFAITAFINFCPIWAAIGINTLGHKKE